MQYTFVIRQLRQQPRDSIALPQTILHSPFSILHPPSIIPPHSFLPPGTSRNFAFEQIFVRRLSSAIPGPYTLWSEAFDPQYGTSQDRCSHCTSGHHWSPCARPPSARTSRGPGSNRKASGPGVRSEIRDQKVSDDQDEDQTL